jgi:type VI secretion system secreted protein VgrG
MPEARPQLFFQTGALEMGSFRVVQMHGFEAISQLYELELELELVEEEPLDSETVEAVLRAPAVLGFADKGVLEHPWYGILREMELVHADGHAPLYRAVMVPSLWYATQTVRTRVFSSLSVPDILEGVLGELGFASGEHYELSLTADYLPREYVLQYAESDYDFIARLMEREGIFYFFDQRPDGEVLIIADDNAAFAEPESCAEITFDPREAVTVAGGALHRMSRRYRVVPQHLVMREYQPDHPLSPMQADQEIHEQGFGLVMLHGQNVHDEREQRRLCKVRVEERALERHLHQGVSSVRGLHCGHRFVLKGHPFGELQDAELVVTAMRHFAMPGRRGHAEDDRQAFGSEVDLLPRSVPFRAPRLTPCPRIDGVIHAKVDGEVAGTPAPLDDQGRYHVLMPFDAAGELGGKASAPMRMAQTFTGQGYGMHFPLHIGADVLIAHVEGDPDRPVIVGALPTPDAITPVVQDNATQSVVRSKANIVIELEDDA